MMKLRFRGWYLAFLLVAVLMVSLGGYFWLFLDLPRVDSLPGKLRTPSVQILDRNGRLLYEAIDAQSGRHSVVPIEKIPLFCQQATLATEDRTFYTNPGFDLRGILRSAWINLQGGETIAGGSTITQQVARNLLFSDEERSERSIRRKLREIMLAGELTRSLSKGEILALYLNQTYYGGMAYGIEAASRTFFGKSVERLDLAECALLAGMPQAPALYNPFTDPETAQERQAIVLGLMEDAGLISSNQAELALQEKLVFAEEPYPIKAPHFVMQVRGQIDSLFSPQEIHDLGGLVVRTTLDLDWQKHAELVIADQLFAIAESDEGLGHNMNNAALVAIDPVSGDILALVGSPDYFNEEHSGAINMAIAPRQPGSALKPLVYAAALDPENPSGGWTAATMLMDVETAFLTDDGKAYIPANYDLSEHGPVLVREALASSLNIPAVLTLQHVGLNRLFEISQKLGVSTLGDPQDYDLSLALGGGAVRLLDLSAAYGAFANGGFRVEPRLILEVSDLENRVIYSAPKPALSRVLDERLAWLISDILSDNDARRLGFGANSILRLDRPAAVKTGTTSNFHDNWTIGYTPDLVVGVWSGNSNYEPMRDVNGLTGAAPIWHAFMRTVLSERPRQDFRRPEGIEQVEVCALSGLLPSEACTYRKLEWFLPGTRPVLTDQLYKSVWIDARSGRMADDSTPLEEQEKRIALDLPPQVWSWARKQGLLLYSDLYNQMIAQGAPSDLSHAGLEIKSLPVNLTIINPAPGSTFIITPGIPPQAQRIPLQAIPSEQVSKIEFWVDGKSVGIDLQAPFQTWWMLEEGEHQVQVEATTRDGAPILSPVVTFRVLGK